MFTIGRSFSDDSFQRRPKGKADVTRLGGLVSRLFTSQDTAAHLPQPRRWRTGQSVEYDDDGKRGAGDKRSTCGQRRGRRRYPWVDTRRLRLEDCLECSGGGGWENWDRVFPQSGGVSVSAVPNSMPQSHWAGHMFSGGGVFRRVFQFVSGGRPSRRPM